MKRLLLILIGIAIGLVATPANGAFVTIDDPLLMQWDELSLNTSTFFKITGRSNVPGPGVEFDLNINTIPSGWTSGQCGDNWKLEQSASGGSYSPTYSTMFTPFSVSNGFGDWSGFSSYKLKFTNTSTTNDWYMVNVYINTGDTGAGEPNTFWEDTWTWLSPGQSTILDLSLVGWPPNLNHVSNVGFALGTNVGYADADHSAGGDFKVLVTAVPIPTTLLLLGSGLLGLIGLRRRKEVRGES